MAENRDERSGVVVRYNRNTITSMFYVATIFLLFFFVLEMKVYLAPVVLKGAALMAAWCIGCMAVAFGFMLYARHLLDATHSSCDNDGIYYWAVNMWWRRRYIAWTEIANIEFCKQYDLFTNSLCDVPVVTEWGGSKTVCDLVNVDPGGRIAFGDYIRVHWEKLSTENGRR